MNYDKIRQMSDKELKDFLSKIANRNTDTCSKCGKTYDKIIKITNGKSTKMLCGICDKCYKELLEFLDTEDIVW